MKLTYYRLTLKKELEKEQVKPYLGLYRSFLYSNTTMVNPLKVSYEAKINEFIDGEVFAKRLGLIGFLIKDKENFDFKKEYEFCLKNESKENDWVKVAQLENELVTPIEPEEILFALPPQTQINLKIEFKEGNGKENARFSLLEGFRLKSEKDSENIYFESRGPFDLNEVTKKSTELNISFEEFKKRL